ncbi:MAG TPA: hypothetical protein VGB44_10100 [Flavobacterium sp.]|jgi:hypothetical protein
MIYILSVAVVLLLFAVCLLVLAVKETKRLHVEKMSNLKVLTGKLIYNRDRKSEQVKLSEELLEKLHTSRSRIDSDLIELQHDLIQKLADNDAVE